MILDDHGVLLEPRALYISSRTFVDFRVAPSQEDADQTKFGVPLIPLSLIFRKCRVTCLSGAIAFVGTLSMFTGLTTDAAKADFRVCNSTENLVGVAIGYRASEGWITEGWWQVAGGACATLIDGQLSSRYYYVYAEDAARGGRWAGDINMCVADNEFKIVGVEDCFIRGFQRIGFREYDTASQGSWMVQLTDAPATQESEGK